MTGPSIHGAQQKSRRCSAKESTILFKRSDDAKRKQSIYSQISLNCYAVGGSNTGPKHSKIIVFPLGFREAFSLLPSCLCGFIWSNTVELGGFRKEVCFSDEIQYPYEDFCESLIRSWQGRGLSDIPQLLQCMDRFFQDNLYSISTEPSFYQDLVFAFTTYCKKRMYFVDTSSFY